jgi:N-glycosidase YbiA
MAILFYKVCEPYGCFSNFSLHAINLEGFTWLTSEHYYQAQKFMGTSFQYLCPIIRAAASPELAAALGRDPRHKVRSDWEQVKINVMYTAVLTKFLSHDELKIRLLNTGDEPIVENSPTDDYWGCGSDGRGQNQLGKILMRIRQELSQS